MSSAIRRYSRVAGFSLAEVLIALAIAAMMAAILTRFVAGTRANAAKVAELTEMAILGETLLARTASSQSLKAGRTDGRSGAFVWRIDIAPVAFAARALRVSEKSVAASDAEGQPGGPPNSGGNAAPEPKRAGGNWVSYHVTVVIEAPSGQSHAVDTIRLGPGDR